ncbi:hypothetical protein Q5752_001967 [Cryptotrichosporon argae]
MESSDPEYQRLSRVLQLLKKAWTTVRSARDAIGQDLGKEFARPIIYYENEYNQLQEAAAGQITDERIARAVSAQLSLYSSEWCKYMSTMVKITTVLRGGGWARDANQNLLDPATLEQQSVYMKQSCDLDFEPVEKYGEVPSGDILNQLEASGQGKRQESAKEVVSSLQLPPKLAHGGGDRPEMPSFTRTYQLAAQGRLLEACSPYALLDRPDGTTLLSWNGTALFANKFEAADATDCWGLSWLDDASGAPARPLQDERPLFHDGPELGPEERRAKAILSAAQKLQEQAGSARARLRTAEFAAMPPRFGTLAPLEEARRKMKVWETHESALAAYVRQRTTELAAWSDNQKRLLTEGFEELWSRRTPKTKNADHLTGMLSNATLRRDRAITDLIKAMMSVTHDRDRARAVWNLHKTLLRDNASRSLKPLGTGLPQDPYAWLDNERQAAALSISTSGGAGLSQEDVDYIQSGVRTQSGNDSGASKASKNAKIKARKARAAAKKQAESSATSDQSTRIPSTRLHLNVPGPSPASVVFSQMLNTQEWTEVSYRKPRRNPSSVSHETTKPQRDGPTLKQLVKIMMREHTKAQIRSKPERSKKGLVGRLPDTAPLTSASRTAQNLALSDAVSPAPRDRLFADVVKSNDHHDDDDSSPESDPDSDFDVYFDREQSGAMPSDAAAPQRAQLSRAEAMALLQLTGIGKYDVQQLAGWASADPLLSDEAPSRANEVLSVLRRPYDADAHNSALVAYNSSTLSTSNPAKQVTSPWTALLDGRRNSGVELGASRLEEQIAAYESGLAAGAGNTTESPTALTYM